MLRDAAAELKLDLSASWMVGDTYSDSQAGVGAGCRTILVETQDSGVDVPESKKKIAAKFHLTREQLDLIEKEGLDKDWPPLS